MTRASPLSAHLGPGFPPCFTFLTRRRVPPVTPGRAGGVLSMRSQRRTMFRPVTRPGASVGRRRRRPIVRCRLGRSRRTTIMAFLTCLETGRMTSIRTRTKRSADCDRSLFAYAALHHPEHAMLIQRVLAIPPKRFDKQIVKFVTPTEVDALSPPLTSPNRRAGEIRCCCCVPSKPVCVSPSSSA